MNTFFPIVRIPKEQLKGSQTKQLRNIAPPKEIKVVDKPPFDTVHDLNVALLDGTLATMNLQYNKVEQWIKDWDKYQRWLNAPKFKKRQPLANSAKGHNFRFQFAR